MIGARTTHPAVPGPYLSNAAIGDAGALEFDTIRVVLGSEKAPVKTGME